VLLHGGWAGTEAYWSTVTDDLERTHLVIASEGRPSFGAYADLLAEMLTALGIERATLVGNSFGATVAWRFAGQFPKTCVRVVLVNGYQPPVYSKMLRWLAGRTPIRALACGTLAAGRLLPLRPYENRRKSDVMMVSHRDAGGAVVRFARPLAISGG